MAILWGVFQDKRRVAATSSVAATRRVKWLSREGDSRRLRRTPDRRPAALLRREARRRADASGVPVRGRPRGAWCGRRSGPWCPGATPRKPRGRAWSRSVPVPRTNDPLDEFRSVMMTWPLKTRTSMCARDISPVASEMRTARRPTFVALAWSGSRPIRRSWSTSIRVLSSRTIHRLGGCHRDRGGCRRRDGGRRGPLDNGDGLRDRPVRLCSCGRLAPHDGALSWNRAASGEGVDAVALGRGEHRLGSFVDGDDGGDAPEPARPCASGFRGRAGWSGRHRRRAPR